MYVHQERITKQVCDSLVCLRPDLNHDSNPIFTSSRSVHFQLSMSQANHITLISRDVYNQLYECLSTTSTFKMAYGNKLSCLEVMTTPAEIPGMDRPQVVHFWECRSIPGEMENVTKYWYDNIHARISSKTKSGWIVGSVLVHVKVNGKAIYVINISLFT